MNVNSLGLTELTCNRTRKALRPHVGTRPLLTKPSSTVTGHRMDPTYMACLKDILTEFDTIVV